MLNLIELKTITEHWRCQYSFIEADRCRRFHYFHIVLRLKENKHYLTQPQQLLNCKTTCHLWLAYRERMCLIFLHTVKPFYPDTCRAQLKV